jgi:hypothetical protein
MADGDLVIRLEDILSAIREIESFTERKTFEDYLATPCYAAPSSATSRSYRGPRATSREALRRGIP